MLNLPEMPFTFCLFSSIDGFGNGFVNGFGGSAGKSWDFCAGANSGGVISGIGTSNVFPSSSISSNFTDDERQDDTEY